MGDKGDEREEFCEASSGAVAARIWDSTMVLLEGKFEQQGGGK